LVRRISIFILFCWGVFLSVFFAGILSSSFKGLTGRNKPAVSVSATGRSSHSDQSTALVASQADLLLPSRPLYPFSIIPGGVENAQELKNALAHDAVAESHYAGFNVAKAHVIRMDRDRAMYVSYRMGDRVFWTRTYGQDPLRKSALRDADSPHFAPWAIARGDGSIAAARDFRRASAAVISTSRYSPAASNTSNSGDPAGTTFGPSGFSDHSATVFSNHRGRWFSLASGRTPGRDTGAW
jgi:hypothetical protein